MKNPNVISLEFVEENCIDITDIVFENEVRSIDPFAFANNCYLRSVTFNDRVIDINASAFRMSQNLEFVHFKKTIDTIDNNAFRDCRNLRKVQFDAYCSKIGFYAFQGCEISELDLNNLSVISPFAFYDNNIKELHYDNDKCHLLFIKENAFSENKLKKVFIKNIHPLSTISRTAFRSNKDGIVIDDCYLSLILCNINAFDDIYIKNLRIDLEPIRQFYFTPSANLKIDNIAFDGITSLTEVKLNDAFSKFTDFFYTSINNRPLDDIILNPTMTLSKINDYIKQNTTER